MYEGSRSRIPSCLTAEILIYQNRRLSRLVCSLKSQRDLPIGILTSVEQPVSSGDVSTNLRSVIETLTAERDDLCTRLDRITARLLATPKELGMMHSVPQISPNSASAIDEVKSTEPDESAVELTRLRKEIVGLRASLQISQLKEGESESVSCVNGNCEARFEAQQWMKRHIVAESEMVSLRREVEDRIGDILKSVGLTEEAYLGELERMAEELASRQQEIHRLNGLNKLLSVSKEQSTPAIEYTIRNPATLAVSREGSTEALDQLTSSLKQVTERLRMKEELTSRILAQHVQIQHLVTGLEQENALLRSQCETLHGSLKSVTELIGNIQSDTWEGAGVARALEKQSALECSMKSHLLQCLSEARTKSVELQEINKQARLSWQGLQEQYLESLQTARDHMKIPRTGSNIPPSVTSNGSLLQLELADIQSKIRCSLCQVRHKSVAIIGCMHCFCRQCVDEKMLNARNRKCPLCMQRFADTEVREVHFLKD